jgi:7-carboxy-7-deazaguanine synthase (Cx14CxxC type)
MTYSVKEIFYTLQGEGLHAGRPAVFCRFAGCNLWTGRETDRLSAVCQFCDTDFVGTDGTLGAKYPDAESLAAQIAAQWPVASTAHRFVVLTGGEPLLQVDEALTDALHAAGFMIAVETNGTLKAPAGIDWICMSPKAGAAIVQTQGHELKLVFPQPGLLQHAVEHLAFEHRLLQPMDGPDRLRNTEAALAYCQANPQWRLSVQMHKMIGIR